MEGIFHPQVVAWFGAQVGTPTAVQRLAWPAVAAGRHVLVTAPTGSGKTLAAFLWALDRLLTGSWDGGRVRVLYVSPLRALNNDVERNLLVPLAELSAAFSAAGETVPPVRVATRSGDTPQEERQRLHRRPPEILITTPESLNILLTSRRGRELLAGVRLAILDEIHAVVGGKRGVHLITAVERLTELAGEVQRVGLSATVRPAPAVARWLGGATAGVDGAPGPPRPVALVDPGDSPRRDLRVTFPAASLADGGEAAASVWAAVVEALGPPLRRNRSTLVFANSRRVVEKLTRLVNEAHGEGSVWSHHGSLAREVRAEVEARLKAGELRGIVATSSLELGIDIGTLDEVVLVQTPPSVTSAVQRIGRAGHCVGGTSRATFLPLVATDLLRAAVMARAVLDGDIEPVEPRRGGLDVLAQVIVSAACGEGRRLDDLFNLVRRAHPYRALPRRAFDLVVEMLAGRHGDRRLRELRPLVDLDRLDGTVRARPGAERTLYMSGGTIPDRGTFHLRVAASGALLGELDEEFVWERSVGDTFTLGVQAWRVERVTHNDVFVRPAGTRAALAPFWRAEERERPFAFSAAIGAFLERAEAELGEDGFSARLEREHALEPAAAAALVELLHRQRAALGGRLPHRHRLVVERVVDPQGKGEAQQVVLHTLWGGRVNRPLALALAAAQERRDGGTLEIQHDDDCLLLSPAGPLDVGELLHAVAAEGVEALVRSRLGATGFFGARFREAAACALLLPREGFHRRTPLWLSRQRAKELLERTGGLEDFPLVVESWRSCLEDGFDLVALQQVLDEIVAGTIAVATVTSDAPSPFAAHAVWKRTNELMYEDDVPTGSGGRGRVGLLRELVFSSRLRPRLAPATVATLAAKLRRIARGYAPATPRDLLAWVVERVVMPLDEWRELLDACRRDHGLGAEEIAAAVGTKVAALAFPGERAPVLATAVETVPRLERALGCDLAVEPLFPGVRPAPPPRQPRGEAPGDDADPLAELVAETLRCYGPVEPSFPATMLRLDPERWRQVLEDLIASQRVVVDELVAGSGGMQLCDSDNLERLLRTARAAARPAFEPLPLHLLPAFLARWQRLASPARGLEDVAAALDRLLGFPLPAEAWEEAVLPARLEPYDPAWLDAVLAQGALEWGGCGRRRLTFRPAGASDLVPLAEASGAAAARAAALFPVGGGRYTLEELVRHAARPTAEVATALWELAWAGQVASDGFAVVREGIDAGFEQATAPDDRAAPRLRFSRWQRSRPFAGRWYLAGTAGPADPLEAEEIARERLRMLLARYGVVFRELLTVEMPALRWGAVFRTLRLMELSGEVVAGQFFTGVTGVQFAAPEAVRLLRDGLPVEGVVWIPAVDPASPCGLGLVDVAERLPRRVPGAALVLEGTRLVATLERRGAALELRVGPDHPTLPEVLRVLALQLERRVRPLRALTVATINGEPAASSSYRRAFEALFHVTRDRGALRLGRRY